MVKRLFYLLDAIFLLILFGFGWFTYFLDHLDWLVRLGGILLIFVPYGLIRWIILGRYTPFDFRDPNQ